jgi:hypothetical protein
MATECFQSPKRAWNVNKKQGEEKKNGKKGEKTIRTKGKYWQDLVEGEKKGQEERVKMRGGNKWRKENKRAKWHKKEK